MEETPDIPAEETAYTQTIGLDYAVLLAFRHVDESGLPRKEKRGLLYSALCLRCLFDNRMAVKPDPILTKYDCLKRPEPQKLDLYELIYRLVSLPGADAELKAAWYQTFPYVVLLGAPHDEELYDGLKTVLHTPEVFRAVLGSRYSANIPDSVGECRAADLPAAAVDWYRPYLAYKDEKDGSGLTREVRELRRLLGLGQFETVLARTERLLDCRPDDENLLLTDIAARVSLPGTQDEKAHERLLKDTLALIDEALRNKPASENYFLYYRGLTLLGLMDPDAARQQFTDLLEKYPGFELADFMLRAMDKVNNKRQPN